MAGNATNTPRMESEKQPYILRRTGITVAILCIIACGAGTWRMSTGSLADPPLHGILHAFLFLFSVLLLAQRCKMIAYAVLPVILIGWCCFDYMYDITAPVLSLDLDAGMIQELKIHLHILRSTYHITLPGIIGAGLACAGLFAAIYSLRRFLAPVHLPFLIECMAGIYVTVSLIFLPLGLVTAN